MRVLVVAPGPSFSVADVQHGWEKALRQLGCEVRTYNLDDRLTFFQSAELSDGHLSPDDAIRFATEPLGSACYWFWPDIILVVSGFFIQDTMWEVWKHRPQTTVLLCTESPYEDDIQFQRVQKGEPDVVLLNDPTNIERFRQIHQRVEYVPHAYDPDIHHPGPPTRELVSDFAFCGTGYQSRVDLISRIDWRGINLKLAGNWEHVAGTVLEPRVCHPIDECFDNTNAVELYRSCKVSANLYRKEANAPGLSDGWAMGPREVELAATRTFFLREPRGEGDDIFPFLPTFFDPDDFGELLRYYLEHEDERLNLAAKAREAISERTFISSARRLLALVDKDT